MNPDTSLLTTKESKFLPSLDNQVARNRTTLLEKSLQLSADTSQSFISIPQFSEEDRLLSYLIKQGLANSYGVASKDHPSLTQLVLCPLSPAGHDKLVGILSKEVTIQLGGLDFGLKTSALEMMAHFNQGLMSIGFPCAGIELVGSGVASLFDAEFLIKNWKILEIEVKSLFTEENFQKLLKKLQTPPSDYDFRILLPNGPHHLLNEFRIEFMNYLLTKMPRLNLKKRIASIPLIAFLKEKYPAKDGVQGRYDLLNEKDPGLALILIKEFAFTKLFAPWPDDVNQYAIGAVSNGSDFTL